jgi:hypothetical protein
VTILHNREESTQQQQQQRINPIQDTPHWKLYWNCVEIHSPSFLKISMVSLTPPTAPTTESLKHTEDWDITSAFRLRIVIPTVMMMKMTID